MHSLIRQRSSCAQLGSEQIKYGISLQWITRERNERAMGSLQWMELNATAGGEPSTRRRPGRPVTSRTRPRRRPGARPSRRRSRRRAPSSPPALTARPHRHGRGGGDGRRGSPRPRDQHLFGHADSSSFSATVRHELACRGPCSGPCPGPRLTRGAAGSSLDGRRSAINGDLGKAALRHGSLMRVVSPQP